MIAMTKSVMMVDEMMMMSFFFLLDVRLGASLL
jgi:hypothetical protein